MKRNIIYLSLTAVIIALLTMCTVAFNKHNTREATAWGCGAVLAGTVMGIVSCVFRMEDVLEIETKYSDETRKIRDNAMKLASDSLNNVHKMVKMNEELLADNRDMFKIVEAMQEYVPEDGYEKINAQLSGTKHLFQKTDGKYELYTWVK